MSDWDNFWNGVEDAVEQVVDFVEDAVEDVVEVVEDVVEGVENVAEAIVDIVEDAAETVADWSLTVADAVIFDPVDFITGGAVDVDYENGQFTADLNLGIGSVGISVGEQGFDAHAGFDIGIASGEMSYDSDTGFATSGSIGVDWGPLPYAAGHLTIGNDGAISIGGEVQATLPLPFGSSIGGEASGEMHLNRDGFGATSLVDVFADGPGDTGARFHNDSSVQFGADGFDASTNTDVLIDGPRGKGAEVNFDSSVHTGASGVRVDADFDATTTRSGGDSVDAGAPIGDQSGDELSDSSQGALDGGELIEQVESQLEDDFSSLLTNIDKMESAAEGVWDDIGQ